MKTKQNNSVIRIGSVFGVLVGLLFFLLMQVPGVCKATENNNGGLTDNDALTYMMEIDALKLNGKVIKVRAWNTNDDSWLTGEYFEPVVVTVDVRNRGGDCLGEHSFYLKKGIKADALEPGTSIMFRINKNMCHPDKALIIIELNVL